MNRVIQITALGLLLCAAALCVWGCFGLTHHFIIALDQWGNAGAGLTQTTAKLNGKHGTIAMADEDIGAAKSTIIHADLVARHEQQQLTVWDERGSDLFNNFNGGLTDLRATIRAGQGTEDAATRLVDELRKTTAIVNDPDKGIQPTLTEVAGTAKDIHAMTPDAARAIKGTADVAENTAGITSDTHKVTTHFEQRIDHPAPQHWYNYLQDIWEIAYRAAVLAK